MLVASSFGGGAAAILTSVLAHLAACRTPAESQVRTIAAPRALPSALLAMPHQLGPAVDPLDQEAVAAVLAEVPAELDRRLLAASSTDQPELVLVVGELLGLVPYVELPGQVGERGPACRVCLLAASTRPGSELPRHPLLPDVGTRLLQRTADEDESMLLLGMADAAYLGGGGRLLFRSEQRAPVELYACHVAPADLDRLVEVMGIAYGAAMKRAESAAPSATSENAVSPAEPATGAGHEDRAGDLALEQQPEEEVVRSHDAV